VRFDPHDLPAAAREFLAERHLATLTTARADGTPHVVPVGFTFDSGGLARVITNGGSVKVRNASRVSARAALCQVSGRLWLTLEGPVQVSRNPDDVADAVHRYSRRYRIPRINPERVMIVMTVERMMGNV